jgi:hypothetical protein
MVAVLWLIAGLLAAILLVLVLGLVLILHDTGRLLTYVDRIVYNTHHGLMSSNVPILGHILEELKR